nr:hypothetical protein [Tanacetum cinerariifolium]
KRQQFYGFSVNRESALDVYSKRRIIAVTDLKIEEWYNYKHLDWILRVEDLQLGVESYQKRLNLTKPDTYRSDLKRREAHTAYSNPRGFIYQNKDKKNRLMRIDELHKFSDGTLNDVRNALDYHLKGIRMQYLPQTIWRKGDKDGATAMIQAIDKMLKTRRIMKSLEWFVGGRLSILTDLQETLKKKWRYLVPAESHIHNCMLIPNYQDNKYQDFRYSDELSNLGRYEPVSPMSLEHKQGDDPIDAINHMMSFLSAIVTSRFPSTNNQLRNSSNPRQEAIINDGRVTVQPVQGRKISFPRGISRTYTPAASGSNSGKQKTVIYDNCKGEGHMSKQCTKPKRIRDDSWFKDKVLLSFGMSFDEFDKETVSSDGLQPKHADLSCFHALNKLHLYEIHVVSSKKKADQY